MKLIHRYRMLTAAVLLLAGQVQAKDACEGFKWDVAREHALFVGEAGRLVAGDDAKSAPMVQLDRLYELALSSQEKVVFAAPPGKTMLADGASAGLVGFRVPQAGLYRVSLSTPFWIDVAAGERLIDSIDFNSIPGCDAPRKIVVYALPAGKDLTLQFSGGVKPQVRVALTAVPEAAK